MLIDKECGLPSAVYVNGRPVASQRQTCDMSATYLALRGNRYIGVGFQTAQQERLQDVVQLLQHLWGHAEPSGDATHRGQCIQVGSTAQTNRNNGPLGLNGRQVALSVCAQHRAFKMACRYGGGADRGAQEMPVACAQSCVHVGLLSDHPSCPGASACIHIMHAYMLACVCTGVHA